MDISPKNRPDPASPNVSEFSVELPNGGARVISEALHDSRKPDPPDDRAKPGKVSSAPIATEKGASEDAASESVFVTEVRAANGRPDGGLRMPLAPTADASIERKHAEENTATSLPEDSSQTDSEKENPARDANFTASGASANSAAEPSARVVRRQKAKKAASNASRQMEIELPGEMETAQEILVINVLVSGEPLISGGDLVATLRRHGLRFGDMNIFHRLDPDTQAIQFSVANAVEPGSFDLADLDAFASPGITFFMRLPAAGDALEILDGMIDVARESAVALHAELKDESMSVFTGQTAEHLRQRVADFRRRQLTRNADSKA